jgi:ADP-heptose:LPS heptosyltransferase
VDDYLTTAGLLQRKIALVHPTAAFATKQWAVEKFSQVAEFLSELGLAVVAIAGPGQDQTVDDLIRTSRVPVQTFSLSLPEVTALASRSRLFVGNDSGIAHIAAAVNAPAVVIFGSSNIDHWRPWTSGPAEVVREEMPCQPCHGYFCEKFERPECIIRVPVSRVKTAIERVLAQSN